MVQWLALESNPDVLNSYVKALGVPAGGDTPVFCDVFGFDPELLAMVPTPVYALIVLYPITQASWEAEQKESADASVEGSEAAGVAAKVREMVESGIVPPGADSGEGHQLWFTRQTVGNACGTVAVMHAAMNLRNALKYTDDSAFGKFLLETRALTPEARGEHLEKADAVAEHHETVAQASQNSTQTPELSAQINLHFVTFLCHNGRLLEMDGRKSLPTDRGSSSPETLLADAARCVQEVFIPRDPSNLNFSMIALAAPGDE